MNEDVELVYCWDHKEYLPADQFAGRALSKNKKQPRCLSCASQRIKHWKVKNKKKELLITGQLLLFEDTTGVVELALPREA